jgi:formylglycine-generating enzyme required for sulfatase activity
MVRAPLALLCLTTALTLTGCGDKDDDGDVADFGDDSDGSDGGDGSDMSDADADGFSVEDGDCDDGDASVHPGADDTTGDGTDQDCDGADGVDDDGDGWASTDSGGSDCDDGDAGLGSIDEDGDCDGFLTAEDCDDTNPAVAELDGDADCDGVATADDCDDSNPGLLAVAADADCDGAPTSEDCDDSDADVGPRYPGSGCTRRIEASTFDMGCTASQGFCPDDDVTPVMPVTLTYDYWIGETEVTQGQYGNLTGLNPSQDPGCGSNCPVEHLSWHEAAAFANAASSSAGLTECYSCSGGGSSVTCTVAVDPLSCDGYRMPTEAEWEGAARCGTDTRYAGGDSANSVSWHQGNSGNELQPVAGKNRNACRLYDMSGNVWEWTQDWYSSSYYSSRGRTDPTGPASGSTKTTRGGAFSGTSVPLSTRTEWEPQRSENNRGMRLVRMAP